MLDLKKVLTFDTETWRIEKGRGAPKLVVASFQRSDTSQSWLALAPDVLHHLDKALSQDHWVLAGHNIAFDLAVLVQHAGTYDRLRWVFDLYETDRVYDTMVLEKLKAIAEDYMKFDRRTGRYSPPYSLEYCIFAYFGEKVEGKAGEDAWRLNFDKLDGVPLAQWPAEAKMYALKDAELDARLLQQQLQTFWSPDIHNQMRASWALHLMSLYGLRTDPVAVQILDKVSAIRINEVIDDLVTCGIYRKEGKVVTKFVKNTKFIRARIEELCAARQEEPPKTKSGNTSYARKHLVASGDPDLLKLADIGPYQKVRTTYLPVLQTGVDWPINPRFNVLVESGRTSASRPNVQNMMRMMLLRECFVPRTGYIYVGCDYHTAELRSLAQVLLFLFGHDSSEMAKSLLAGRELHLEMAAALLGCSYEEAVANKKTQAVKDARQLAKAANFGLPGGLGAQKFMEYAWDSYRVHMSLEDSKMLKVRWLQRFPEMRRFFQYISLQTGQTGGDIVQMVSNRVRGNVMYTAACNTLFQGLSADGAKKATYYVQRECWTGVPYNLPLSAADDPDFVPSPLFGSRPVLMIHDEIVLESPFDKAVAAAQRLSVVMVEAMKEYLPDIPVLADAHMMRRWYKSAAPVHLCPACGKKNHESETMVCKCGAKLLPEHLVPWEPEHPGAFLAETVGGHPLAGTTHPWTLEEIDTLPRAKGIDALGYQYFLELRAQEVNPDTWCNHAR